MFGVTVMVLHVSSNVIFTFDRLSPSLVLEPVFRLSEVVTSVKVKDVSGNSFPGDHGTAVGLFTFVHLGVFGMETRCCSARASCFGRATPTDGGRTLDNRSGGRQRLDRSCYGGADLRQPIREMVHRIRRFSAAQKLCRLVCYLALCLRVPASHRRRTNSGKMTRTLPLGKVK